MTQLGLDDYAVQPAARAGDPTTSQETAVTGGRAKPKRIILRTLLEHGPLHDERLAALTGIRKDSCIKRRGDLVKVGLVHPVLLHGSPVIARTERGRPANVWSLTYDGVRVARSLPPEEDDAAMTEAHRRLEKVTKITAALDIIDEMLGRLDDQSIRYEVAHDVIATAVNELRTLTT